jgi:hydrogenase 3 maturation protease
MPSPTLQKKLLMGIGNILNGDDGVGCYIAQELRSEDWISIDCSTAPENFGGQVLRYAPIQVVIVDAAMMGLEPGEIRKIDGTKIQEVGFSTHTMSLAHFLAYVSEECADAHFIGIQPEDTALGNPLTPSVKSAADCLIRLLKAGSIEEIKPL